MAKKIVPIKARYVHPTTLLYKYALLMGGNLCTRKIAKTLYKHAVNKLYKYAYPIESE
jgi:hypothetical protein